MAACASAILRWAGVSPPARSAFGRSVCAAAAETVAAVEATGVTINYSSSENYEQQIVIDTQAGSPPNIAILPQPGLLQDLASKGLLVPLGDDVATFVRDNYGAGESWVDLGTYKVNMRGDQVKIRDLGF